ncbi:MAG: PSP1 C-terminal domain-containing protein [Planctomycetaceae bacterium]
MHCLVRYGVIPEVARCQLTGDSDLARGQEVVIESHRGLQLGTVVEALRPGTRRLTDMATETVEQEPESAFSVIRAASAEDQHRSRELRIAAEDEFTAWQRRIAQWQVDVQLVDLEWTLDRAKLILYVLNERGPECTKLAIQAAAAGLGVVEVQPVSSEGIVSQPNAGCGSCGCHN